MRATTRQIQPHPPTPLSCEERGNSRILPLSASGRGLGGRVAAITAVLAVVVLHDALPVRAEKLAPTSVQAKRQAQERARAMARELVTGVLDLQLTKLEVNGL